MSLVKPGESFNELIASEDPIRVSAFLRQILFPGR
jgi:hypothetical protein